MKINQIIRDNLEIIGRILANASYHYYNLDYLINKTSKEERIVFNSYPALKKIRITTWTLIVLDLNKLLSNSANDKFRIIKLLNSLTNNYKTIKWEHHIDLKQLEQLKIEFKTFQSRIKKIKDIRDTQIAHFDDINLNYRLELTVIFELISFCQKTYNTVSYALNNSTTHWEFSELDLIVPVVKNLNKYVKLKNLYFSNRTLMNDKVEMTELEKIIKVSG